MAQPPPCEQLAASSATSSSVSEFPLRRRVATAVCIVDAVSRHIAQVAGGFEPLFGYTAAEIVGQPWAVLHAAAASDPAATVGVLARELESTGVWCGDLLVRRKDGAEFWSFAAITRSEHPAHGVVWIATLCETPASSAESPSADEAVEDDVGVWEWDLTHDLIFWDARMFAMFDVPPTNPVRYETWAATFHPADRARTEAAIAGLRVRETRTSCAYRIVRRDGTIRQLRANGASWADAAGRVTRIIGVNIDVTAHRQVEASLRDSEEKFAKAFYRAPVFMSITTLDTGTYLDVNEQAQVLTGYSRAEMIGRSSVSMGIITAEDRSRLAALIAARGHVDGFDLPFARKDGRRGISRIHAERLSLAGRPCLLMIAIDVTAARKAEEQIRQLSQAVEQSPSAVMITDPQGRIEYVNPKFTQVAGYSLEEVRGQNSRLLKAGDTPPEVYRKLWQTISAGGTWRGTLHNRAKNGESFWENATISPIRDPAGHITHYLALKEDLTTRKLLEDRYRQAQKMEAVGQLAGGLAHDYNNILTASLMLLNLLQSEPSASPALRAGLRELEQLALRSARLTRQLLTFSRRQPIQVAPLDLDEVLSNLLTMLRHLLGEHIRIDYRRPPAPLRLMADDGMIEQLVTNLAVNARDAMAPQGGTLVIRAEPVCIDATTAARNPEAYPGEFVRLSLSDTGCGMSAEIQKRIFEPFFTTKEVGKGTGLGLSTVFGIVQQHHGWIEVESTPGAGSTFHVYFPQRQSQAPPSVAAAPSLRIARGAETILVVEDEALVQRTIVAGLQSCGYHVLAAGDGPSALALWARHGADVNALVTDMVMPGGLSGLELALRLRADRPELRVLLCSGYSPTLAEVRVSDHPHTAVLGKPFELSRLSSALRDLLDRP